jgi:hypothetical protein
MTIPNIGEILHIETQTKIEQNDVIIAKNIFRFYTRIPTNNWIHYKGMEANCVQMNEI